MKSFLVLISFFMCSIASALTVKTGEVKVLDSITLEADEIIVETGAELVVPESCSWFFLKAKKVVLDGKITARSCSKPSHKESFRGFKYQVSIEDGEPGSSSTILGTTVFEGGRSLFGNGGAGATFDSSGEDASYGFPGRGLGIGGQGGVRGNHGQALFLEVESWEGKGIIDVRGKDGAKGLKGSIRKVKVLNNTLTKELCVEPTSKGVCAHVEKRYSQEEKTTDFVGGNGGNGSGGDGGVVVFTKGFEGKVLIEGGTAGKKGRVYEK